MEPEPEECYSSSDDATAAKGERGAEVRHTLSVLYIYSLALSLA